MIKIKTSNLDIFVSKCAKLIGEGYKLNCRLTFSFSKFEFMYEANTVRHPIDFD